MSHPKVRSIKVVGLLGNFDYEIEFPEYSETIIIIAPNGYGKTALLSLISSCLSMKKEALEDHSFKRIDFLFQDGARWIFTKTRADVSSEQNYNLRQRSWSRRGRPRKTYINFEAFSNDGEPIIEDLLSKLSGVPKSILADVVDRCLPNPRTGPESFIDYNDGSSEIDVYDLIRQNELALTSEPEFQEFLRKYGFEVTLFGQRKYTNLFIETQRLLYDRTVVAGSADGKESRETKEEILRQSAQLAKHLETTYKKYASTSQSLDRSFPNRLIARVQTGESRNPSAIRDELNDIEAKRKRLTEAGILVEAADQLVPPTDEFAPEVAKALTIYIEDSNIKLATYDGIYSKISVFKELFNKKIFPKEMVITAEGAKVRRHGAGVPLDRLSSGEKHEFIMLYKLIFETPEGSMVLIDEPEISLHVAWQLEFMSDLAQIQAANNFQCIIATHSPQIIQGQDDCTIDLSRYANEFY